MIALAIIAILIWGMLVLLILFVGAGLAIGYSGIIQALDWTIGTATPALINIILIGALVFAQLAIVVGMLEWSIERMDDHPFLSGLALAISSFPMPAMVWYFDWKWAPLVAALMFAVPGVCAIGSWWVGIANLLDRSNPGASDVQRRLFEAHRDGRPWTRAEQLAYIEADRSLPARKKRRMMRDTNRAFDERERMGV